MPKQPIPKRFEHIVQCWRGRIRGCWAWLRQRPVGLVLFGFFLLLLTVAASVRLGHDCKFRFRFCDCVEYCCRWSRQLLCYFGLPLPVLVLQQAVC